MTLRWRYLLIVMFAVSGCNVAGPGWRYPEHLYSQRLRATYHDPYPSTQMGPPIEGARPEQYEVPRAIPVQAQWFN